MKTLTHCVVTLIFLLFSASGIASEIINDSDSNACSIDIDIIGSINKGDAARFEKIATQAELQIASKCNNRSIYRYVRLKSDGGDVDEAVALGTEIRNRTMRTMVPIGWKCFSSCVFVLAGGVSRLIGGYVGIHRPYFTYLDSKTSVEAIRASREKAIRDLKAYLERMDVSTNLLDDMLAVKPSEIKILTSSELDRYRLSGEDANFEESETARRAHWYGLTSAEYRKKMIEADKQCGAMSSWTWTDIKSLNTLFACRDAIMLSISKKEAKQRRINAEHCGVGTEAEIQRCRRKAIVGE